MLKLDPVALTDVGRKRDHNEDYLGDLIIRNSRKYDPELLAEKGYLFAVADGMGGYASGEVASEMAITTLFDRFYNAPGNGNLAEDLLNAIIYTNSEVHRAGQDTGQGQMGTTLTIALVKGNRALVGNVGDSRTYLIRNGIPLRVTRDHSLVQDQIDMGAITPEQAQRSMIKNIITRAIGHRDEVEPDLFEQELQNGDVLLLCSDGLHGLVQEMEMGSIVASAPSLKQAAQQMIEMANERGGPDNISVVLIGITEVGEPIPSLLETPTRHSGMTATMPVATVEQPTSRMPLANGTGVAAVPLAEQETTKRTVTASKKTPQEGDVPTQQMPATKKGGPGLGGIIIGLLLIIVIAAIVVLVLANGNSSSPAPAATATAATTTAPATTVSSPIPTVTPQATTAATTTGAAAGAAIPSRSLPAAPAGSPVGAVVVSTITVATPASTEFVVDRNSIKAIEIWLLGDKEKWPEDITPGSDLFQLQLTQEGSSNTLFFKYIGETVMDTKVYHRFRRDLTDPRDLPLGTYFLDAYYQNQQIASKGLQFNRQRIVVQDTKIIASAELINISSDNVLNLFYSFATSTGKQTGGESQPGSRGEQQAPLPEALPTPTPKL